MMQILKSLKKALFVSSALLSGIVMLIFILSIALETGIMNPSFHKYLFKKHDVYKETQLVLESSYTSFLQNLKTTSPEGFEKNRNIFELLQASLTPETVNLNLDIVRDGIFEYLEGRRTFLPDIYLNNKPKPLASDTGTQAADKSETVEVLSNIDKVNLSAIMLYINRSDITDKLFIMKFIYFTNNKIPVFSTLSIIVFMLSGMAAYRNCRYSYTWFKLFLITVSTSGVILGILIFIYTLSILPANLYPLTASLPLQRDIIFSYLYDCALYTGSFMFISSLVPVIIFLVLSRLAKTKTFEKVKEIFRSLKAPKANSFTHDLGTSNSSVKSNIFFKYKKTAKIILFILLISIPLILLCSKVYYFKSDYNLYGFSLAVAKLRNPYTAQTQVIPAKDAVIYDYEVRVFDGNTGKPISGTGINISGKSDLQKKDYNTVITTNNQGIAKTNLDKGTFRFSFIPSSFPSGYNMPSPFFFELKTAGTTIITINLEEIPKENVKLPGIAEIELLDSNNNVLENVELLIDEYIPGLGYPKKIFSYSNSDGIAVFKLISGIYKVKVTGKGLPEGYTTPHPLEITIMENSVNRYTLQLVKQKAAKNE